MTQPPLGPPAQGVPPYGPPPQGQPFGMPQSAAPGYGPPPQNPQTQAFTVPGGPPPMPVAPPVAFGAPSKPSPKRRWPWIVAGLVIAFGVGAAAGGGSDEEPDAGAASAAPATTTVVITETAPAPVAPPTESTPVQVQAAPSTAAPATPVIDFAMPDLVGLDLQSAQNQVQTNGVFYSTSHDLLGSRSQLVDSNWIVCTQNIAPGEQVTGDVEGAIDFGVVKREEGCP